MNNTNTAIGIDFFFMIDYLKIYFTDSGSSKKSD
jgi:hypothetical protein